MAENPGGDRQGVGGGVEFPRGNDTPGVEELPRGYKTSGGTPEGNIIPGEDIQGRGGYGKSPATRDTKGIGNNSHREEMASGKEPAAPQIPQQGTEEGGRGEVIPHRHSDGADGARPEHGTLVRRKCGLLAPEELAGNQAKTEPQGSGDGPKDTSETWSTDGR